MMDVPFTGKQFSLGRESFKIIGHVNGGRISSLGMIEQFSNVHNYRDGLKTLGTFSRLIMISTADS